MSTESALLITWHQNTSPLSIFVRWIGLPNKVKGVSYYTHAPFTCFMYYIFWLYFCQITNISVLFTCISFWLWRPFRHILTCMSSTEYCFAWTRTWLFCLITQTWTSSLKIVVRTTASIDIVIVLMLCNFVVVDNCMW